MALADHHASPTHYTALARRYRPSAFEECIGQQHVAMALRNAIDAGRVAHAYLFCGSRGVGKTSMARIFAKALNCATGPTTHPCGTCESCQAIAAGSDLDVVEIDGASNRGIEEIRELRQGVSYRPSRSAFKIYIIDEVHMLTKEAFNALLKTLEEPPAHVKFVFATTEAQKIPETILSRCQRYDFAGIGLEQIIQRLREIVESEKMTAEPDAVELIARRARGSMRDSQSLLDQVLAFAQGHLTAAMVHELLGTVDEDRIQDVVHAFLSKDSARCLEMVESAVHDGVALGEWIGQILDYLRDLLVLSVDPNGGILSMSSRHRDNILEQARAAGTDQILEMMDIVAGCRWRLRGSSFVRTIVEMTLVRLCRLDQFLRLGDIVHSPPTATPSPSKKNSSPLTTSTDHARPMPPHVERAAPVPASNGTHPPKPAMADTPALVELTEATAGKVWARSVESISDPILHAMASQVGTVRLNPPKELVLSFAASAGTSRRLCEEKAELIARTVEQVTGIAISLRFEESADDPSRRPAGAGRNQASLREEANRESIVQQAEDLLGAKIYGEITVVDVAPAVPNDPTDSASETPDADE